MLAFFVQIHYLFHVIRTRDKKKENEQFNSHTVFKKEEDIYAGMEGGGNEQISQQSYVLYVRHRREREREKMCVYVIWEKYKNI